MLELNGAFNVGNRGMVEFIEVFKNETEYLHAMITATQEKFVPAPGRHGTIYVDSVIVAHSNEAEWQKFKAAYERSYSGPYRRSEGAVQFAPVRRAQDLSEDPAQL